MTVTALAPSPIVSGTRSSAARKAMVDSQLRTNDVIDPALVAALRDVPREAFLPESLHACAYIDRALPLAGGRALNPVLTTARLIADARIAAGQSVLLIGAATGYAAAVLARLGASVTAVESDPVLLSVARAALTGTDEVELVDGPLAAGAAGHAPFDAMIVDGAVESLPVVLLDQAKPGGRIACGLIDGTVTRLARAIAVGSGQAVRPLPFADLECVHLPGFAPSPRFTF
jgi:protein-L-isoaspartate(D-aspartate) O-methyltransferase